jgi:hypothetical protein
MKFDKFVIIYKYPFKISLQYFWINFTNASVPLWTQRNYTILSYAFNFLDCLRKISLKNIVQTNSERVLRSNRFYSKKSVVSLSYSYLSIVIFFLFFSLKVQSQQLPDSLARTTADNKIYKKHRQFFYRYQIHKNKDTLVCKAYNVPDVIVPFDLKFKLEKKTKPIKENDYTVIHQIALSITEGDYMQQQSGIRYDYINNGIKSIDSEVGGVIEIGNKIILSPPRNSFFKVLELSPFPMMGDSVKVGYEWTDRQVVSESATVPNLMEWKGELTKELSYKITKSEYLRTNIGTLFCYLVAGTCLSSLGETKLIAYYNEQFGFVKMDFFNIDGSRIIFDAYNVKQK